MATEMLDTSSALVVNCANYPRTRSDAILCLVRAASCSIKRSAGSGKSLSFGM